MEKIIKLWIMSYNRIQNNKPFELKGLLKDINIWILAYSRISKNKGSITPGPDQQTLDGISLKSLENLKTLVLEGNYQWIGARRIEIPKLGKTGTRPLSIPAASDKIIQEVLRLVLEPIFELTFSENSHGFRKGRSCHTALGQINRDFKPITWVIEGDLKSYFDTIDYKTLMTKLERKIKDKLILKLISSGLKNKIFYPNKTYIINDIGVPQGGILSPLLSNIYLDEFDKYMENKITLYNKGKQPKHNKIYEKARYNKESIKGLISYDPFDPSYRRLTYVRYADDFLIGLRGPIKDAKYIKEEIKIYLKTNLHITLNENKTKISHIKDKIIFLGHKPIVKQVKTFSKYSSKSGNVYRKTKRTVYGIDCDTTRLLNRLKQLKMVGIMKKNGKTILIGKAYPSFLPYQQSEIIRKYNSIIRGLSEWWKYAGNRRESLHKIAYLLRYSAAKTLAQKYNISLSKVFTLAGKDLSRPIKNIETKIGITDSQIASWKESVSKKKEKEPSISILYATYSKIPGKIGIRYGKEWKPEYYEKLERLSKKDLTNVNIIKLFQEFPKEYNFLEVLTRGLTRGIKLLYANCSLCDATENIQIHHIKKVSAIKGKTPLERRIKAFARKQIPLCSKCHLLVHNNNWRSIPRVPRK